MLVSLTLYQLNERKKKEDCVVAIKEVVKLLWIEIKEDIDFNGRRERDNENCVTVIEERKYY